MKEERKKEKRRENLRKKHVLPLKINLKKVDMKNNTVSLRGLKQRREVITGEVRKTGDSKLYLKTNPAHSLQKATVYTSVQYKLSEKSKTCLSYLE
jgi:hypothetical protein